MTLLVVPSGTTTVVATWSVLTELIVVTLIQLFQTFIHIWGGRGVTTGMVTEVVQPRGLSTHSRPWVGKHSFYTNSSCVRRAIGVVLLRGSDVCRV